MLNLKTNSTMQVRFTNPENLIRFNPHEIVKPFFLTNRLIVNIVELSFNLWVVVPLGFKSDGCSIPWVFRLLLGCKHNPKYVVASIIHDYIVENPQVVDYNRKLSSQIFYNVLLKEKVNKYLAYVLYLGVEIGQIYNTIFKGKWRNHEQRPFNI